MLKNTKWDESLEKQLKLSEEELLMIKINRHAEMELTRFDQDDFTKQEFPVRGLFEMANEMILKAADIIERDGWCRRRLHQDGAHCVIGALNEVNGDSAVKIAAYYRLTEGVKLPVAVWNDHYAESKDHVLRTMRRIART